MAHLLLDEATATGASASIFLHAVTSKHTVSCYYTDANASITALTIKLQGSDDNRGIADANAHWYDLAEHTFDAAEITAKQAMFHVDNKPVKRVRVNITTLTGEAAGDVVSVRYIQGVI